MFTREEDSKRKETLFSREMVIYGTPILYKPDKHYILTVQNINRETKEEKDMIWKWIKAIFTKPLTILKSIYFNIFGINQDLATKRLKICDTCSHKLQTSVGEVCDECGCILENKTRIEDEHCDLCKW